MSTTFPPPSWEDYGAVCPRPVSADADKGTAEGCLVHAHAGLDAVQVSHCHPHAHKLSHAAHHPCLPRSSPNPRPSFPRQADSGRGLGVPLTGPCSPQAISARPGMSHGCTAGASFQIVFKPAGCLGQGSRPGCHRSAAQSPSRARAEPHSICRTQLLGRSGASWGEY